MFELSFATSLSLVGGGRGRQSERPVQTNLAPVCCNEHRYRSRKRFPSRRNAHVIGFNQILKDLNRGRGANGETPEDVLARMAAQHVSPDAETFRYSILLCVHRFDVALAEERLNAAMKHLPVPIPGFVYAAFFYVCARCGNPQRAKVVWDDMLENGQYPTQQAAGAYVDCLSRAGLIEEAQCLLNSMPNIDSRVARTSIVAGFARQGGREDEALGALREMAARGFHPNARAYTAMFHSLGKARRGDECIDLLEEALEAKVAPDALLFESVISACGPIGQVDGGLRVLRKMKEYGIDPTDRSYEGLIYACATVGLARRAKVIFDGAASQGLDTPRVVSAYASALLRRGVIGEEAISLVNRMKAMSRNMSDVQMGKYGLNPRLFRRKIASIDRLMEEGRRKSADKHRKSLLDN